MRHNIFLPWAAALTLGFAAACSTGSGTLEPAPDEGDAFVERNRCGVDEQYCGSRPARASGSLPNATPARRATDRGRRHRPGTRAPPRLQRDRSRTNRPGRRYRRVRCQSAWGRRACPPRRLTGQAAPRCRRFRRLRHPVGHCPVTRRCPDMVSAAAAAGASPRGSWSSTVPAQATAPATTVAPRSRG